VFKIVIQLFSQLGGALVFYTTIPLPQHWPLEFSRIARWAPWIGLLIGGLVLGVNASLQTLPLSAFVRAVLVTAFWIYLTGGLHLDGVMDTADGLAVPDPERRLSVMSDSRSGAFGVMAAIILILLKVGAIAALSPTQSYALVIAPIWGRWGQVLAIARYPYLKAEGKGAFHRRNLKLPQDLWPSFILLLVTLGIPIAIHPKDWPVWCGIAIAGFCISWSVGAWLNHRLQGMTGDSYGAIVEWTEAFIICSVSLLTK
jgi:adenosylcobinamide-GDP ribazoletransferase